ncbi:MCP four helix bundle domain-containing protein [Nafulsella turpanensis]|uniref:MCP four helix bundle domain-containing protein n=1 Tax=Nafulsella turpanensis TaxID=1265690 RepID=UPI000344B97D|nr:MCP four helix bundle domain-containing protein [Nafulsella turpanensis]
MQFWKGLNNRGRILLLLLGSLVLLNGIVLVTIPNLSSFSRSFASMLNDRLVPSTEIAQLQELSYKNRLYLEDMIFRDVQRNLAGQMLENNTLADKTLEHYQLSYFTEDEREHTDRFLEALQEYRRYEKEALQLLSRGEKEAAAKLFEEKSQLAFLSMIHELNLLSGIQLSVGRALYEKADENIQIIKLVAYFSLFLSLILAAQLFKVLGIRPLEGER